MKPSNKPAGAIVVSPAPTARCAAVANASFPECDSVAEAARQRLRASGYFGVRPLSCEHHEGVLVLRGQVASWHQKQLAQESVRCLSGVEAIINAVDVLAPSQSERRLNNFTDGSDRRLDGPSKARRRNMLILSRKRGERIVIGENFELTVVAIRGERVQLGRCAPQDVSIHREEIHCRPCPNRQSYNTNGSSPGLPG